jgi:hypothetical protein
MMGLRGVRKGKAAVAIFSLICLLTAGLALIAEVGRAAGPPIIGPPDMVYRGVVVTNKIGTMQINKDEHLVSREVIVTDRQGKRRAVIEVIPGEQITFHLTKGEIDRIECECLPRGSRPGSR